MTLAPRLRRAARLGLPAVLVSALALSGCAGVDTSGSSAAATGAATDKALHDMLPDKIKSSGTLTLGALWETPPMISVTTGDTDTPVGVAPDLAAAIAPILGVDVAWKNMQWPGQLPGVQAGAVDGLLGQVTDTAERESSVVDLVPFYKSTFALLMAKPATAGVTALASLCGKQVGVPNGSVQVASIERANAKSCAGNPIRAAAYPGATLAVTAVKAGTIDAWLDSTTTQAAAVKADPNLGAVQVPDAEIPPSFLALAVGKKSPGLTNAFAAALRKLIENGSYAQIMQKHDVASGIITAEQVVVNPLTGTTAGSSK